MKWLRIYQPLNSLFWIMLALNELSYALAWIVQNRALNTAGMLLVGGVCACQRGARYVADVALDTDRTIKSAT